MPDSPSVVLADIQKKIAALAESRDRAEEQCRRLRTDIDGLKAELSDRDARLQKAMLEIEFLTLSHKLADSPDALAEARRKIAGLIRKVDAAISLVKSDLANQ